VTHLNFNKFKLKNHENQSINQCFISVKTSKYNTKNTFILRRKGLEGQKGLKVALPFEQNKFLKTIQYTTRQYMKKGRCSKLKSYLIIY